MLLYLDNCAMNRPFDDQNQMKIKRETAAKLSIQANVVANKYRLAWSYMLDSENNANPYDDKRNTIAIWKHLASEFQTATAEVLELGTQYQRLEITPKDALHLACAAVLKSDYFITTDHGLLNKNIAEIKIINPLDFVRITEN